MITVENLQKKIPISPTRLSTFARKILKKEGVRRAELSLVFVSPSRMSALNRKFLKRSYATDVLAFNLREAGDPPRTVKGEIVICPQTAVRQARQFWSTPGKEILLYVLHGILHLLGYDDRAPADVRRMRKREELHLKALKL